MKIKKKFQYEGIELRIVECDEPYMSATEPMKMIRVLAPNGGTVPMQIRHKQTLKSIMAETIETLDNFKSRGADVIFELNKPIPSE